MISRAFRRNRRAVSPVIGTILMVAITVVLAAVLYVMVTGTVQKPGNAPPTVTITAGQWANGSTVVSITSAPSQPVNPADLTFQIVAQNGSFWFNGASGAAKNSSGTLVNVTFTDATGNGQVGPDDNIRVSVTPAANATAVRTSTFKVLKGTDVMGQTTL